MTLRFTLEAATDLAARAVRAAGASDEAALSLARATVSANAYGKGSSGLSHLMDYLAALRAGRIAGDAEPLITSPAPAAIHCSARGGVAHLVFDRSFDDLRRRAETFGLALFAQNGSYTTGELGYYPRRLAQTGLVAFAATSGPALMTVAGAKTPVYCTNPIAFAAPLDEGAPLLIDQASSATAFVQLRHYAERGETLPPGWAVDGEGQPTIDPSAALRGALLAFGGARGANIALMVEVMAAGLAGANWALDAPSFPRSSAPGRLETAPGKRLENRPAGGQGAGNGETMEPEVAAENLRGASPHKRPRSRRLGCGPAASARPSWRS